MNTNSISNVTPESVTAQFNAWYAVAVVIGGVVWHMLLKAWPAIKTVYPWIIANRGIGLILGRFFYVPKPKATAAITPPEISKQESTMKTLSIIGAVFLLTAFAAHAQINVSNAVASLTTNEVQQTAADNFLGGLVGGAITNVSVDPYATYAPNAPKGESKVGGGAFVAYNFNQFASAGIGVDWLGVFSLVSANMQFQAPFHLTTVVPLAKNLSFLQNVVISPFALVGLGTPYSGNGHFNGSPMAISDVGGYIAFGHLWNGQFNAGVAWGKWVGQGPYGNVVRYHAFFGYMKSF